MKNARVAHGLDFTTDKIRMTRGSSADVICTFRQSSSNDVRPGNSAAPETRADHVDLGRHVDQVRVRLTRVTFRLLIRKRFQTSLNVSPQLPLEIVMQMFRRMG
jgi:hypothetical protein